MAVHCAAVACVAEREGYSEAFQRYAALAMAWAEKIPNGGTHHAGARVEQNDAADLESVSPEENNSRESVQAK